MTPNYQYVSEYLRWVRACFAATAQGRAVKTSWAGPELDAKGWHREFMAALHRRINSKGHLPVADKVPYFMSTYIRDANGHVYSYGNGAGPDVGKRIGWRNLDPERTDYWKSQGRHFATAVRLGQGRIYV